MRPMAGVIGAGRNWRKKAEVETRPKALNPRGSQTRSYKALVGRDNATLAEPTPNHANCLTARRACARSAGAIVPLRSTPEGDCVRCIGRTSFLNSILLTQKYQLQHQQTLSCDQGLSIVLRIHQDQAHSHPNYLLPRPLIDTDYAKLYRNKAYYLNTQIKYIFLSRKTLKCQAWQKKYQILSDILTGSSDWSQFHIDNKNKLFLC